MGSPQVKEAVSDAGPLIHLNECGCLQLLKIFSHIHIPRAIWSETVGEGRIPREALNSLGNSRRHDPSSGDVQSFVKANKLEELHIGEQECLYVCRKTGISLLLTDDLAVREMARELKITPVGSLGIIVKSHYLKFISLAEAERYLAALQDESSLFVTRTIVDLAIGELRRNSRSGS